MTVDLQSASDRDLISVVAEGDRGALHELFTRHQPWLAARVRQRCSDPEIVAEVVNDTFLVVWEKPRKYSGEGEVAAWLWGIAIRTLLHRLRPRKSVFERLVQSRPEHVPSAEEAVLLGVEHGDVGHGAPAALARAAGRRPGHGPRRTVHARGRRAAGDPQRHRQEPDEPGPARAEGGSAVSTERTEWHAGEQELAAYVSGRTPRRWPPRSRRTCSAARAAAARLAGTAGDGDGELAWARLADAIDRPTPTPLGSPHPRPLVRAVRRSRPRPWSRPRWPRVVLVGLVPLAAAVTAGDAGLVALLVLAPLAPMAAVALAYREWADPAGEISLATPSAGLRLVALRALARVRWRPSRWRSSCCSPSTRGPPTCPLRLGAAWCLPGLALAALVLLAGTTRRRPVPRRGRAQRSAGPCRRRWPW